MILIDQYGNIRTYPRGSKSGHGAIKREEAASSRVQRARAIRKLRHIDPDNEPRVRTSSRYRAGWRHYG